ncbi:sodium/calcium exchanger [Plakobranchus ocellatus]|uniref:Sodium/calcium exchanger n=1 Tax=Plakobranchus ocellatus TaxID=259542 RepID=A0AAV3YM09_9GAST|nr:sodium/calcium exchanger [Plakobranchus ocellatus]
MAIVLLAISPNRVEVWEAVLTFIFFPLLIGVAYLADKDFCMKKKQSYDTQFVGIPMIKNGEANVAGDTVDEVQGVRVAIAGEEKAGEASRPANAKDNSEEEMHRLAKVYDRVQLPESERPMEDTISHNIDHSKGGRLPVVQFTAAAVAVMENEGKVRLGIKRTGLMDVPVSVRVETINGTAVAGDDYKPFNSVVEFKKNEGLREIWIEIVDDFEWEPDEFFFAKLKLEDDDGSILGPVSICEVTIINDDEPGTLAFAKPSFVVKETGLKALIPVVRLGGADGHVSVRWTTKDITAIEGKDYQGKEGLLEFDNQETTKNIIVPLFESNKEERDESFAIELGETDGGATLGKISKTIVTIVNDEEFNGLVSRILNMTKANLEALELQKTTYVQQFVEAMNVNGGDLESATFLDYILHFLTFFWKILFAFIPPAQYFGGWPAFIISLAVIGLMTAIIGDLAGIFGCLIGLEDSITAITLVALGTSMPDTFASKTAAVMEKTADSSVGNVNGSNSVNVFLGLGLPWLLASIYHEAKGSEFAVPADSLGFSVVLYSIAAVIAITTLIVRRNTPSIGGELGGPKVPKILSSILFVSLWVLYILFSALQAKGIISVQIGASSGEK